MRGVAWPTARRLRDGIDLWVQEELRLGPRRPENVRSLILLGSDNSAEGEPVITGSDIQTKLNALATHAHAVTGTANSGTGAVTGTAAASSAFSGLAVTGSPVV